MEGIEKITYHSDIPYHSEKKQKTKNYSNSKFKDCLRER